MNIPKFFLESRGLLNLLNRFLALFQRFGFTSRKMEKNLTTYLEIGIRNGCLPTFPITATTLKRHPKMIQNLQKMGADFAIHGFVHTDYSELTEEAQRDHLKKAIRIFEECRIPFQGFRSPYLRWNGETQKAVQEFPFLWTSHQVVLWDVVDLKGHSPSAQRAYEKVLKLYHPLKASNHPVLPRKNNGLVEIPVSIPDDEALIDRLGIRDPDKIFEIWKRILDETYRRGELFALQLHHERIPYCDKALENLLKYGRTLNPPVWMATLNEIAGWWKGREETSHSELWPGGSKSALSITGDIDSLTLFDFLMRIFEV